MLKTTQEGQGTQACDTASPQCPCECHPAPTGSCSDLQGQPAPPCLGPGGALDAVVTGPWAAGANQLKLPTLDHVGRRLLRPGLQEVALDPGACAAEAVTLVWESPTCLLSPVPCPWGREEGLSAECPTPFPRHGPAGQTASTGQRYTAAGSAEHLRAPGTWAWHPALQMLLE